MSLSYFGTIWQTNFLIHINHRRLHGIASPVLTATGFVNEKGQFSTPPHRIHGGLLGTWVKYNQNYFYALLWELTYRSDP